MFAFMDLSPAWFGIVFFAVVVRLVRLLLSLDKIGCGSEW